MAAKLPAPLPVLAAGAGAAAFAAARFLGIGQGAAAAPAAAPVDPNAAPADSSLAGSTSDLWSQFGGGGTQDFGDGSTGPGSIPGPYDPGGIGSVTPPPSSGGTTTTPPPASSRPASLAAQPSGAAGWVQASGIPLYTVSAGTAKVSIHGNVLAWVGAAAHYKPNATLRRLLTGGHAGLYVHVTDVVLRS